MKEKKMVALFMVLATLLLCLGVIGMSFASDDQALVSRGKELFTNKEGLNTKLACVLCHQGSKVLDPAKIRTLGDTLPETINKYIVEKAKGTALPKDSEDMKALEAYLRSDQR